MRKYVIGRITVKPGTRDLFIKHRAAYVDATRTHAGMVYFQQALDQDDPDEVIVIECWESPEAHAAHAKHPDMAALMPSFTGYVLRGHFEELDVDKVHDVVFGGQ